MNHSEKLGTVSRLKKLREKLGLSQREFAKVFGVSPGAVAHWERGLRSVSGPVARLLEIYESGVIPMRQETNGQ